MEIQDKLNEYFDEDFEEFNKLSSEEQFKILLEEAPNEEIRKNLILLGTIKKICDKQGNILGYRR
jgi:hypothetical protein